MARTAVTGRGDRGLLRRGPHVPAACRLRRRRPRLRGRDLRRGRGRLAGLLGPPGRRPRHLVRRVAHDPRLGPAVRPVVRRRHPQRVVQLPRPPRRGRPGRQGRLPLGGRAGRHPHDHLRRPARRGAAVRQRRSRASGVRQGRPGRHLHADDPRAAGGDAGVRPHRGRRTRWCSAASRPTRWPTASTTPSARCWSPPTAGSAAGQPHLLKPIADVALATTPSIEHVVVVDRVTGHADAGEASVDMTDGRDHWYHDLMDEAAPDCEPERMDSEDLLYLLYTSGTTAKPKGIMHTTGGYLTQVAFTHSYVFDLKPETDVYWCAADIGWVTGHSYIVYGPLANGATSVIYEGTPDTPGQGPAVGHRRALRRHDPLHGAHRHPHVHEVGSAGARGATTCRSCGCSGRSASRSTPRRGCGTTPTSAAAAARSSTPGGRPRRAPS